MTAAKDGVLIRRRLRIFAAAAALVLLCAVCVGGVSGADVWNGESIDIDWAGSGTQANPYLITSAAELRGLSVIVNGETYDDVTYERNSFSGYYFRLTTHILLNDDSSFNAVLKQNPTLSSDATSLHRWSPIGTEGKPFMGTFDGGGYSIGNVYSSFGKNDICGLFGYVESGTLKNINLLHVLYLPEGKGNQQPSLGGLVGLLRAGIVEDCHVVIATESSVENNGNNPGIGGLIGRIANAQGKDIDASDIGEYLKGSYSVAVFDVSSSKTGLIVGNPSIGESGESDDSDDDDDDLSASYTVHIHEMDLNGEYITKDTRFYFSTIGTSVNAEYVVPEGFSLDTSQGTYQGTVTKDNSLVLSVFLKRNTYTITFVVPGSSDQVISGFYGSSVPFVIPNLKPGYTFLGWDSVIPSTMPAKNLVITARVDYVDPKFTIVIPDSLIISEDSYENGIYDGGMSVIVDVTDIVYGQKVSISVRSENSFRLVLTDYEDYSLGYNLYVGNSPDKAVPDENGNVVVGSFSSIVSTSIPLRAEVFDTPMYSGNYQDTLVFHVQYSF